MKLNLKMMILAALFTALTAIGAFIKIPLTPPITLQFFFIALGAMLLGKNYGALSQLLYLIIGLFIAPIFASGGGIGYIAKPTFGYIIGFIPAAYIIGWLTNKFNNKKAYLLFLWCFIGVMIDYAIGVPYLQQTLNISFTKALNIGFITFLPGDILKCIIAAVLAQRVLPAINKMSH